MTAKLFIAALMSLTVSPALAVDVPSLPVEAQAVGILVEQVSCQGVYTMRALGPDGALMSQAKDESWRSEYLRESWKEGDVTLVFARGRTGGATGWTEEVQVFRRIEREKRSENLIIETNDFRTIARPLNGTTDGSGRALRQTDSVVVNTYLLENGSEILVKSVVDDREVFVPEFELTVRPFEGGRTETRVLRAPFWSNHQAERGPEKILDTVYVQTLKDESSCTFTVLR